MIGHAAAADAVTILVVEDNPVSRRLLRLVLSSSGFRVAEAGDAAEALAEASREPPALVVQDLQLPDMDGTELPPRIRATPGCANVPVVAVTGFLSKPDGARLGDLGFSSCLIKPIDPARLVAVVRGLLPAAAAAAARGARGLRVIVADDDPVQRTLVSVRLEQAGWRVLPAADGSEALELAASGAADAVVSDVLMPRLDGFQLCRRIRADAATAALPVVLVTSAYGEEEDRTLAHAAGADAYCLRTPDLDDALDALVAAVRRRSGSGRAAPAAPAFGTDDYLRRVVRQLERQVAEKDALARRLAVAEAEVAILGGLSGQLRSAASVEDALGAVLYRTIDAAGLACGAVFLRADDSTFRLAARCGIRDARWPALERFVLGGNVLPRVLAAGRPVAIDLPENVHASLRSALRAAHVRTLLGVPLSAGHEAVGVLLTGSSGDTPADWESFASAIGSHVGYAIALSRWMLRVADSERRFRELLDGIDAVVWEADARTLRLTFASLRVRDLLGWEPATCCAPNDFWSLAHPTDGARARRTLREAMRSGRDSVVLDLGARTSGGRSLRVRHSVRIFRDANGAAERLRGALLDVTEREETARRNAVQLAVTEALAESPGVAEAAPRILSAVVGGLGWSVGTLWLYDEDATGARCVAVETAEGSGASAYAAAVRGGRPGAARGILDRLRRARTHVWIPDIAVDPESPHTPEALGSRLRTAVAFPLRLGDALVGAIEFLDTRVRTPDDELLRTMAALASQVGQFAERRRAQAALLDRVRMAAFGADVSSALNQGDALDATLAACAEAVAQHLGAEVVTLWMHDAQHARLDARAGAGPGWTPEMLREKVAVGGPGAGRVALERRPRSALLPARESADAPARRGAPDAAFSAFPLVVEGALLGVLEVRGREPLAAPVLSAAAAAAEVIALGVHRTIARDENRALEEQLAQSRKLEAIGRLAGGIAHDFNNLLTVISGYASFALAEPGLPGQAAASLGEVVRASDRAADLVNRLLAFSRRQILQPSILDLSEVVDAMLPMVRRLVGEDVDLAADLAPQLGWCSADRGQIEQVVMNLVVNARDAMPAGGTLSIATSDVTVDEQRVRAFPGRSPGPHVQLEVRDTGVGMDPVVLARIFEPFFTTKPGGKGTGLGLATVHGIVHQSGGILEAESAPGRGSVFRVLLPRADAPGDRTGASPGADAASGGTETVLVVEDEERLRAMVVRVLALAGYTTLEAADGEDALVQCARHGRGIGLVLTDVIMPRMGGRVLSERLGRSLPGLPVLFMSGNPDSATAQQILSAPGTPFLPKPFTPSELRRKVRDVLDAARRG